MRLLAMVVCANSRPSQGSETMLFLDTGIKFAQAAIIMIISCPRLLASARVLLLEKLLSYSSYEKTRPICWHITVYLTIQEAPGPRIISKTYCQLMYRHSDSDSSTIGTPQEHTLPITLNAHQLSFFNLSPN